MKQRLDLIDAQLRQRLESWLQEDVGYMDVTTVSTVDDTHLSKGIIHAKEAGTIAGLPVAEAVFQLVDQDVVVVPRVEEGETVHKGTVIMEVEGRTRSILQAERLALNLLQRMSGIATRTKKFVDQLEGLPAKLVDTRKTTPGHRSLEKYAVRVGGGTNHRFGLYDAVLIKDNHIKASGSITEAVRRAKEFAPHTMKIEVEVENKAQWEEAVAAGADIIMLDNMDYEMMSDAVHAIRAVRPDILIEASGGVTLETVRKIAETGVDLISVGSLTSSIQALDISLDLNEKKGHEV